MEEKEPEDGSQYRQDLYWEKWEELGGGGGTKEESSSSRMSMTSTPV